LLKTLRTKRHDEPGRYQLETSNNQAVGRLNSAGAREMQ